MDSFQTTQQEVEQVLTDKITKGIMAVAPVIKAAAEAIGGDKGIVVFPITVCTFKVNELEIKK